MCGGTAAAGGAAARLLGRRARLQQFWQRARAGELPSARAVVVHHAPAAVRFLAIGTGAVGLGATGVAVYALSAVHTRRRREYTDEFVLTPEDLNMPYEEVQFFTEDGISLTGWYIPQTLNGRPSRRVVVCCHPHNSSKSNLLGVARGLWERRYSVFMFDFRSFARTPTRQSVGYFEQRDALAAIKCARRTAPEGAEIGLIGASMGGAVALMVGHQEETGVVGIATDCAFARLSDVVECRVAKTLYLPAAAASVIVRIAEVLNPFIYGYQLSEVSPADVVREGGSVRAGQVPLLLMHAEGDEIVTASQGHAIYSAAAVPQESKQLVVVQHCHHVGCFFKDRVGYISRLAAFFEKAFLAAEEAKATGVSKLVVAPRTSPEPSPAA